MRITVGVNNWIAIDGSMRTVDTSTLAPGVELIYFDTVWNRGMIQYLSNVLVPTQVRNFVAEKEAEDYARDNNLEVPKEAIYKTVQVPKPNLDIVEFPEIQSWIDKWTAAEPPPPPPPPPPDPRLVEIDNNLNSGLIGGLTRDQLRAMNVAEYNAWFTANFSSNAQLIGLLRRLTLLCIRRLL